jgi:hypothetical protein
MQGVRAFCGAQDGSSGAEIEEAPLASFDPDSRRGVHAKRVPARVTLTPKFSAAGWGLHTCGVVLHRLR